MFYKSFCEVPIWKTSVALVEKVYWLTEKFPKNELYGLTNQLRTNQLRRSAISVSANIAESWGRFFYADKIRVLYIARGEIAETRSHLYLASKLNYCSEQEFFEINKCYDELNSDLNKYKKALFNSNKG